MLHKVSEQATTEEKLLNFGAEYMNCCRDNDDGPRSALLSFALKDPGIGLRRYFYTNMLRMSGITNVSDTPSLCRSLLA